MTIRITDPRKIQITSVVVDHNKKMISFFTPTNNDVYFFEEYDEWGTIRLDGIAVDIHILFDDDLIIYLEPLEGDTETGYLKNTSGGYSVGFAMDNPLVTERGSIPADCIT